MSTTRPLSGLCVIEIGHSIAAPYAGMILGELGAEVIKVENPQGGDAARGWGPPFAEGAATCFHAVNRGKRGITVDLADPRAAGRLRELIQARADVVIHNLKYGALDKYGLSGAALVAEKPSLIYCNLGAFGASGPLRERPGYDPLMQAYSGLMSLLGEDGRPPVRVTVSIIDIATGMWAVIAILAALQERAKNGRGGVIDTSLYETALAWMTIPLAAYLADGRIPARCGSGVEMIVPYQAFAAASPPRSAARILPMIRVSAPTAIASSIATFWCRSSPTSSPASRSRYGRRGLTRPAFRTGRSTPSTRSSPTPRRGRSASSSNGRAARCRWSGCRCRSTAFARL